MAEEKKTEKAGAADLAETAGTTGATGTTETPGTSATDETSATEAESSQESQSSQSSQSSQESRSSQEPQSSQSSQESRKPAEPDWKDRYARLLADFDNFKKRTARDREDTYRYAEADILKDILPTVDNLALALANAGGPTSVSAAAAGTEPSPPDTTSSTAFVKGVQLVYDALLKALKDHGAEPFDSLGKELDTEKMEAIATLPSADVAEGLVSNEVKRGWMLKDKVLRVAQVVVSSGKPA